MSVRVVRVLHISDIHCGRSFVPQHIAAALRLAATMPFDAIAISGDLTQRARVQEFRDARVVLDSFNAIAPLIVVPGNHDIEWWRAPFGIGTHARIHERYRALLGPETEPTLHVPGVSLIGVNSAAGMLPTAVSWYPRDWRVKGGVSAAQLRNAQARMAASPVDALRILVLHHNVVRGQLSNRWGLTRPQRMLDLIAGTDADVVCAGHDHEERVEVVTRASGTIVSSTANTLSSRMRGRRASAVNVIEADGEEVRVGVWTFDEAVAEFVVGDVLSAARARRR